MEFLTGILIYVVAFFGFLASAFLCFSGVTVVMKPAEKHSRFTRLDRSLPLQGRWLRYATAALLTLLGILSLVLAWCALVPLLWVIGDH